VAVAQTVPRAEKPYYPEVVEGLGCKAARESDSLGRFLTLMRIMRYFIIVLLLSCISLQIQARPYATGLTNESGAISFRLNESADGVLVVSGGGAVTNDLGALDAGLHTFALTVSGPFEVHVTKSSPPGFITPISANRGAVLQIGTDTNSTRFNQPRGLVVNTDPASPYFGRIYVSNGASTNTPFARPVGDGIYVLNPDMTDALGQGDSALTGGLDFSTGGAVTPYRLSIGQDGNLYIADWSDSTGSLYMTDPDVSVGSGTNILGGPTGSPFPVTATRTHGSIAAAVVEGSLATGDLTAYVIDEDLQIDRASTTQNQRNSVWRHDIGGTLPSPADVMPTLLRQGGADWVSFASQTMDLHRGTNGYFYVFNYRSTGNDRSSVTVLATNGTDVLFSSLPASRTFLGDQLANDLLRATGGGAVSPNGDYIALINIETNGLTVVPLIDGVPDITNRLVFHGMGVTTAQGRDVAFDKAGNLYAVSQGAGLLRAFSPGGTSTAITGSDGTFRMLLPANVNVVPEDSQGYEEATDTISFKISRTGSTSEALTVNLTWSGTASNGVDYASPPETVVIPAGQSEVIVTVTPIDDAVAELTETVILNLGVSPDYNLGTPANATGTISDNEAPVVLRITPSDTNAFERFPSDTLAFTITRLGNTNTSQFVLFGFAGSATLDTDYTPRVLEAFLIPEGVVSTNYLLHPVDDSVFEGDETVTVSLVPNDYQVDSTAASASGRIREDEYPPQTPIFSDDFNVDTSSNNWTLMFWSSNNIPDYTVDWAFDYGAFGIPPAPGSLGLDTLGVRISVNKTEGTPTGAAAVNLYPTNRTFSGDYVLRFDLYLQYGTVATTEHALAGINHSGLITNRISQSATNSIREADGIWIAIENDGSANREWAAYTSTNANSVPRLITNRTAAAVATLVPSPPYAVAGSPGNLASSTNKTWATVELSQTNGVVTLAVNKNVIYRFTNTFGFDSGTIMIGYNDQFDSAGSTDTFAIFDNVRVERLGNPVTDTDITSITISGNNVLLDFDASGQASDFHIESTPTLSPPAWAEETGATVAPLASGFRATVPVNGTMRFYRVRR
jgi:hypothetical protein